MLVSKNTLFLAYKSNLLTKCIELFIFENISLSRMASIGKAEKKPEELATDEHGKTRNQNTSFRAGSNTHPLGARSKGSNGVVAVGLPHRNYSVFKQAAPNKL